MKGTVDMTFFFFFSRHGRHNRNDICFFLIVMRGTVEKTFVFLIVMRNTIEMTFVFLIVMLKTQ